MFKKGIEKYRLALAMIKDGVSPEKVKMLLQDAERYAYKGKKFSWPDNPVTIRGIVPYTK